MFVNQVAENRELGEILQKKSKYILGLHSDTFLSGQSCCNNQQVRYSSVCLKRGVQISDYIQDTKRHTAIQQITRLFHLTVT